MHLRVKLLGHTVSGKGVSVNNDRVKAILDCKRPTNVRAVRRFLGMSGYYRRYIKDYAKIVAPLTDLLKGDQEKFLWSELQETSYNAIREKLCQAPVLSHFNEDKVVYIHTDASKIGLGAVLSQEDENGKLHPIQFASRKTSRVESSYNSVELEMLAILYALNHFAYLIKYHPHKIYIQTDCQALTYYKGLKEEFSSSRLTRLSLKLMQYDNIEISYTRASANKPADFLSRCPVDEADTGAEDEEIPSFQINTLEIQQRLDPVLGRIIRAIEDPENADRNSVRKSRLFYIKDNVLYKKGDVGHNDLVCLPLSLATGIIDEMHKGPLAAHLGTKKILALFRQKYWLPNVDKLIAERIKHCVRCQLRKHPGNGHVKPGPLQPVLITKDVLEKWHVDALGPWVTSNNNKKYILAAVDSLSAFVVTKAVERVSSGEISEFLHEIVLRFGVFDEVCTDNGSGMVALATQQFISQLGAKHIRITPYNSQANGLIEAQFKTITNAIAKHINHTQRDWDKYLDQVTLAMNVSPLVSRGNVSAFYALYGRNTRLPIEPVTPNTNAGEEVDERVARLYAIRDLIKDHYNDNKVREKQRYDRNRVDIRYDEGDQVLVYNPRNYVGQTSKLLSRYVGPYTVIEPNKNGLTYLVKNNQTDRLEKVHVKRIKKYYPPLDT